MMTRTQTTKPGALAIVAVLLLAVLWYASHILLLSFAGLLLAIFLRSLSDLLSQHTPCSTGWALLIVVITLLTFGIGALYLLAPAVSDQVRELSTTLPHAIDQLRVRLHQYPWIAQLLDPLPLLEELLNNQGGLMRHVRGVFSTTLTAITNLVVVFFVGLYLAANPTLYQRGLLYLVPLPRRTRAQEILDTLGYTLRRWLLGQLAAMLMISVLITLGLWLLDVRLALVLGLMAGLLEFIPNFGPVLSVVPAGLLALLDGPATALAALALYLVVQVLQSYAIQPLIQQKAVALPPAGLIVALILFGSLFGFLGLLLATPLAAAMLVLVKMIYVEDILGDRTIEVKGEDTASLHSAETLEALGMEQETVNKHERAHPPS